MQQQHRFLALLAPAATMVLAGCSGTGHSDHVVFAQTVVEQEPNDSAFFPQGLGALFPGDCVHVVGYSSPWDTDGFAFVAATDLRVDVQLVRDDFFADLDLCVWDPFLNAYALCMLTDGDEFGSFTVAAGSEFHLVVDSFFGDSGYTLTVEAQQLFGSFASDGSEQLDGGAAAASQASPLVALTEGVDLSSVDAERRREFDRYDARDEGPELPDPVLAPGLPGSPLPLVPMFAPSLEPARGERPQRSS